MSRAGWFGVLPTIVGLLGAPAAIASFVDVAGPAGVVYLQRATPFLPNQPPEAAEKATGGAAPGDVDGDGWTDLVVTRVDAPPILFRNLGGGAFVDATMAAGDLGTAVPTGGNGVAFADVDNDGDLDLYVTAVGPQRFYLFVNDGSGAFTEEAVARGAAVASAYTHYGMGVAAGDFDRDGWLDLFVTEWRAHPTPPAAPLPGRSQNRLLRNRGAAAPGFFEDVTQVAGVELENLPGVPTSALGTPGFSPGIVDLDGDGWPELTWVADWGTSRLFWNDGDGTFTDGTVAANVGTERSGMGSTHDDFDGDGRLDWMTTSIFGRLDEIRYGVSNQLYLNGGARTFTNLSATSGIADGGFGWGLSGFDFDNDGDQDVVQTNGFLETGHEQYDLWANDRTRLFENDGSGAFTEVGVAHGITDAGLGRAAVTFDYDRDGDLDVLIANHGAAPHLYRNDGGNTGHWLQLTLAGVTSNREGLGAVVTVDPDLEVAGDERMQMLLGNPGFLGHDERVLHFGLGARAGAVARVRVRWPSGIEQTVTDVAVDQRRHLVEPAPSLVVGFGAVTSAAAEDAGPAPVGLVVGGADTRGEPPRAVDLAIVGGTATAGVDVDLPLVRRVALPPADYRSPTVVPVMLPIRADEDGEGNETLELRLEAPSAGVTLGTPQAVHTIVDDDPICRRPLKSRLTLRHARRGDPWRWEMQVDELVALGDPGAATTYLLVLRDGLGEILRQELVTGAVRWKRTRRGYQYGDRYGVHGPIQSLGISGTARGAKLRSTVKVAGNGWPRARAAILTLPVRVTLTNAAGGCWRAEYGAAGRNDGRGFRADLAQAR